MANKNLTAERLRELLDYCPDTGIFIRRTNTGTAKSGDIAGWAERNGYIKISIDGAKYYAHRCAVLFMTGQWPAQSVDHIDGNPSNNAYKNLRCVSQQINTQNLKKARCNNRTGFLGVAFNAATKKYSAECKGDDGSRLYLGLFATAKEAHIAYINAKRLLQSGCTI
jgi:hypothetical protein